MRILYLLFSNGVTLEAGKAWQICSLLPLASCQIFSGNEFAVSKIEKLESVGLKSF